MTRPLRPRSFAGQLALLLALALLVAQGINFALLLAERRERAFDQSVEPAIARLVGVAERAREREGARRAPRRAHRAAAGEGARELLDLALRLGEAEKVVGHRGSGAAQA